MTTSRVFAAMCVFLGTSTIAWATPDLTLTPNSTCYQVGATVTVNVNLSNGPASPIVGGQFTLSYNTTNLTFVSASPAATVWTRQVYLNTGTGTIDYAVGIPDGGTGASSGTMAILTFTAAA